MDNAALTDLLQRGYRIELRIDTVRKDGPWLVATAKQEAALLPTEIQIAALRLDRVRPVVDDRAIILVLHTLCQNMSTQETTNNGR